MKNRFMINGDVTTIFVKYLDRTITTIIDTKDLPIAQSFNGTWTACFGSKRSKLYIQGMVYMKRNGNKPAHKKQFFLARLLMGFPEGLVVDHINDDSLDNRRSVNLQAITNGENVRKQIKMRGKGVYRTVKRMARERGIGHYYDA